MNHSRENCFDNKDNETIKADSSPASDDGARRSGLPERREMI